MIGYDNFIEKMEQNYLDKGGVIDVLNIYVNGGKFLQYLGEFKRKDGERGDYYGVIFSEEYEQEIIQKEFCLIEKSYGIK